MENDQFRKKVYMQTHSSTLINSKASLIPQWISENQINFTSSYEFSSYNIETQTMDIITRNQKESQVLQVAFKQDHNDPHNEMYYIYQDQSSFYLIHQGQQQPRKMLLHKKDISQKSIIVQKFLDYIIMNKDEPLFSNQNLINKTQQLIQQIKQSQEQPDNTEEYQYDIHNIIDLKMVYQCNFAVILVQMKSLNGVMLVNINKAQHEAEKDFQCEITAIDLERCEPLLDQKQNVASRLIYLFPEKILEIHKTSDITQFVFLTDCHLLLIKINYDLMELCVLHKVKAHGKINSKIVSLQVSHISNDGEYIVALVEVNRLISMRNLKEKKRRFLKLFKIEQRRIVDIHSQGNYQNCLKYESYQQKTLKFLDEASERTLNIKFSDNVVQSRYELSEDENEDFASNIIMNVFNSMLNEQGRTQQKILFETQNERKKLFFDDNHTQLQEPINKSTGEKVIKEIGGLISNKNMIILWEKDGPILHICKIVNIKDLQDRHQKEKEVTMHKNSNKILLKQKQMKDIYAQLIGNPIIEKQETMLNFQSRIQYIKRIEVELPYSKISGLTLSPNNYNMLIVSTNGQENKESFSYSIFQLELFMQLSNPDPNMFLKSIRYIYKNKSTDHIATSLVREMPIFLTGNLVHTSESEMIDGALSFDIHPQHLFMAVSFGFTSKIYAFQGNQRLSSLHTINVQGIKHVKYSPMGNHLCLLASKSIKVIDSYSFMLKFIVHEKNSSFSRCSYSSNGLEFYTISENHYINIYNTFDYSKIDFIKPMVSPNQYKPTMIRNYSKYLQYCIVLENGSLLVKYKSEAIVVTHQMVYKYSDNEKISCIEVDEKNGILFVGSCSGKLRAHIWPMKDEQIFDHFTEIRIGFTSIQSMTLSNLHHYLYLGSASGNTSKVKFFIDRDRGNNSSSIDNSPLFAESSLKYVNMNGNNNIEKVYKFVLANSSSINEQLPQKLRLEYKLSEVINKLNEQMYKLKSQIKEQIEQKIKLTTSKFDINLYHHLNKMITTKLSTQYLEEQQANHKEIEDIKQNHHYQLKSIINQQNQLIKEKSVIISNNAISRKQLKEANAQEMSLFITEQERELEKNMKKVEFTQRKSLFQDEQIFHLPNNTYDYQQEKNRLVRQLQTENKMYYQLRKECTYKETAIKGMNSKKIKQESLEFKFQIETNEMKKKHDYNKNIVATLKLQIEEAEVKVHQMQTQASIIKTSAQFKKVANLDEMNDACSYKLWVKENTEKEIHELSSHLRVLEEFLQGKSGEMVELIYNKGEKLEQIGTLEKQAEKQKQRLKMSKINLLDSKSKIRKLNPRRDYQALISPNQTARSPEKLASERLSAKTLEKIHSTRQMANSNKDVSLFNSIMDKQMNYLKTTMKIHKRKVKNFGKENGELLTEFEKLKYQNKNLDEQRQKSCKMLRSIKKEMKNQQSLASQRSQSQPQIQLIKTSFQKYLQNKSKTPGYNAKYSTAPNTPSQLITPPNRD